VGLAKLWMQSQVHGPHAISEWRSVNGVDG